jgi:hypothetical protein
MTSELLRAYQLTLRSPLGVEYVLPDLARVCHALERAPDVPDLWVQGRFAGWQDIWLHVQSHLRLTEEEMVAVKMNRGSAILRPEDFRRAG